MSRKLGSGPPHPLGNHPTRPPNSAESRGSQGLGAGFQGLGPTRRPKTRPAFCRTEKSPGRGLAKGWESAETAAADVGSEGKGTGYPRSPPPPPPTPRVSGKEKGRVFTLSVTETIQHAPRSADITPILENQMEKKMENEMETGIIYGVSCVASYLGILWYPI